MTEKSLTDALAGLGIAQDGTLTEAEPEHVRFGDLPFPQDRRDYRREADWLALFDPQCDCGMCPAIPCPNRGVQGFNNAVYASPNASNSSNGWITEDEFWRRSRMPLAYRSCTISNWEPDNHPRVAKVRGYISSWPPEFPFLVLHGDKGNGKTHLACGVMRYAWERHGKLPAFADARELWLRVRSTYDEERKVEHEDDICRVLDLSPLVVLDDYSPTVWAELATPAARSFFGRVVNRRYANGWPTVVTMNGTPLDDPTTDRVMDTARTVAVGFSGPSWRTK